MIIKLLSNNTINKIAAGEVVERPASVVKELLENSIDAGATKVDIILEKSGKNLIIVSDNGSGMIKDDLELSIIRHATSKLDEEDLLNITSFGFRGEALSSISAVSKVKITSQTKDAQNGHVIIVHGGELKEISTSSTSIGTIVEVRDLFFATPARLKFLRSDKTELAACVAVVKRIALAYPYISLSLTHDGKEILKLRQEIFGLKKEEISIALQKRSNEIVGKDFANNSSYVSYAEEDIEIFGYASLPTFNRSTADDQFLFINNRPVKDKILNIAVRVAYQDFLARDRHPVCVLFINIKPHLVDVNVHPAKSEVRFHDPNIVRSMIIGAIRSALTTMSHKTSTTIASDAIEYMQKSNGLSYVANDMTQAKPNIFAKENNSNFRNNQFFVDNPKPQSSISEKSSAKPLFDLDQEIQLNNKKLYGDNSEPFPMSSYISSMRNMVSVDTDSVVQNSLQQEINTAFELINDKQKRTVFSRLGVARAQISKTYIIAETQNSVVIVDQHAAHERLGYEKIKSEIAENGIAKQRLLIPEIIELPDENRAELIKENSASLLSLGLSVAKFGEKSIIVYEVPTIIGDSNIKQLINDIADYIANCGENIALTELIEHITETYACHHAIRAGRELSIFEMNELLDQMDSTPFSGQCNHGRPTYIELQLKDIDKLFGRK